MDISDLPLANKAPLLRSTNPLIQWLWDEGWTITNLPALSRGLGKVMVAAGIPVMRLRLTLRTMHPQLAGLSHSWLRDTDSVEEYWPPLTVLQEDAFLKSPYALLFQGAGAVRRRLDIPGAILDFSILEELRAQGATDYVALPLVFADGRINAMTLATDRPGGFTTGELQMIAEMLPVLARLMEVHALRRTAKTVLETYLGHLTGERVLDGLIHRGEGEDIHAVIWLCDLRGSTPLADKLPAPCLPRVVERLLRVHGRRGPGAPRRGAEVHRRRDARDLPDRRRHRASGAMPGARARLRERDRSGARGDAPDGGPQPAPAGAPRAAATLRHRACISAT